MKFQIPDNVNLVAVTSCINCYVLYANVWASIEAQSGADSFDGVGGFVSKTTHQVVMRYRPGIVAKMQVQFNGHQFQIESVQNPDERNKMLLLECVEINDNNQQNPTDRNGELA